MAEIVPLAHRGVLRLSGPDVRAFLQGVLSNDVEKATEAQAIWAAFLTPQGKYLHDFFLVAQGDDLLLEGELERLPDLKKRLKIYKLRAKAEITGPLEDFAVAVVHGLLKPSYWRASAPGVPVILRQRSPKSPAA